MSIQKKLSVGTTVLLANLQKEINEDDVRALKSSDINIEITEEKLGGLLEGYKTTIDGAEHSVSVLDVQKVANFRHDYQQAARVLGADLGHVHMSENEEAESFRLTFNTDLCGNKELSVQTAFFRPGKEDSGNCNFVSITDTWNADDEDKAVDAHLKSLTKKLAK